VEHLDLTLASPAANLALDEAVLELCEEGTVGGCVRFWESREYFVALGYNCNTETDVNVHVCAAEGISLLRRSSGGGTVLQGPGCWNYAVVLPIDGESTEGIQETNTLVMERNRSALAPLLRGVLTVSGTSDLALDGRKISGNAQRRLQRAVLVHGTVLYRFDLAKIGRVLRHPARQPAYRGNRSHAEFLTNVPLDPSRLRRAFIDAWDAADAFRAGADAIARAEHLVRTKHGLPAFIRRR
jgi:lipoate-protein ligase A